MKKLFLLAIISAMIVTTASAQETKSEAQTKKNHAAWEKKLQTELNLTAEQTAKFNELNASYNARFDALAKDESIDKAAQKEKKMALKKEKEAKLLEILTPEQQAKYREIMEKKKAEAKPAS